MGCILATMEISQPSSIFQGLLLPARHAAQRQSYLFFDSKFNRDINKPFILFFRFVFDKFPSPAILISTCPTKKQWGMRIVDPVVRSSIVGRGYGHTCVASYFAEYVRVHELNGMSLVLAKDHLLKELTVFHVSNDESDEEMDEDKDDDDEDIIEQPDEVVDIKGRRKSGIQNAFEPLWDMFCKYYNAEHGGLFSYLKQFDDEYESFAKEQKSFWVEARDAPPIPRIRKRKT
jgi:hypothetical protein